MRTRIPNERINDVWSNLHPIAKQPPVKVYYTSKAEINRIKDNAMKGQHGYAKGNEGHGKKFNTDDPAALHITGKKYDTILLRRNLSSRFENSCIKHELNHAYEDKTPRNKR